MRDVKERRPATRAGIDDREHAFQVRFEIAGRVRLALEYERLVARIPPAMPHAARKQSSFASTECDGLAVHGGGEPPADHYPALVLIDMDVHRGALAMRRQGAVEIQHLVT